MKTHRNLLVTWKKRRSAMATRPKNGVPAARTAQCRGHSTSRQKLILLRYFPCPIFWFVFRATQGGGGQFRSTSVPFADRQFHFFSRALALEIPMQHLDHIA